MTESQPIIIKKVKKGHGGHHGGAWKVAYADFVTAMMAFFLVMWIINLDSDTRRAIEGYFQDPAGFSRTSKGQDGPLEGGRKLSPGHPVPAQQRSEVSEKEQIAEQARFRVAKSRLEKQLKSEPALRQLAQNVSITLDQDGMRVELIEGPEDMFFQSGSADMRAGAVKLLAMISKQVAALGNPVSVEGHTDRHPYSGRTGYTNWELSSDRANAARRVLEASGLPPSRIVEVRGYADRRPRVASNPYHYSNRRVSLLVRYDQIAGRVKVKDDMKSEFIKDIVQKKPNIVNPDGDAKKK